MVAIARALRRVCDEHGVRLTPVQSWTLDYTPVPTPHPRLTPTPNNLRRIPAAMATRCARFSASIPTTSGATLVVRRGGLQGDGEGGAVGGEGGGAAGDEDALDAARTDRQGTASAVRVDRQDAVVTGQ